jgi:non-canonical purine NTP pyrophosphatase (RdgB/HAM1 family)
MTNVTFITGNQHKADYLTSYLGYPVKHRKLELDEIQSLSLREIVDHKVRQAYDIVGEPVLVEDVALEFAALGRLPGPFIKYFLEEMSFEDLCELPAGRSRQATARCVFGYFDGSDVELFEGQLSGAIPERPSGDRGFGWDSIFIPEGYDVTRACLDEKDNRKTYLQIKPFAQVKAFLEKKK